jgi:hypothetical protein
MKMPVKHFFFFVFALANLIACKKNNLPSQPQVRLESPADTTIITAGDTVLIKGQVSDNKSMHELYFTLQQTPNGAVLLNEHPYTHGAQARNFSYTWITTTPADYTFTVEVWDHDHHITKAAFPLTVH